MTDYWNLKTSGLLFLLGIISIALHWWNYWEFIWVCVRTLDFRVELVIFGTLEHNMLRTLNLEMNIVFPSDTEVSCTYSWSLNQKSLLSKKNCMRTMLKGWKKMIRYQRPNRGNENESSRSWSKHKISTNDWSCIKSVPLLLHVLM